MGLTSVLSVYRRILPYNRQNDCPSQIATKRRRKIPICEQIIHIWGVSEIWTRSKLFYIDSISTFNNVSSTVINISKYRIWLPYATVFSDLPALTLSRFAYSAQSEGVVFFEEFRKVAAGLDRIRNVDLISTTEATRRKLEDILIRETNGELDQMTSEVVATSFDECVRMKHIDLVEENRDLNERAEAREAQVIRLLARDYVNKLGWFRVLLLAAKYWWLLGFGILFAVTTIISDNVYLRSISMMPILIQVVQFGLDKFVDDRGLRYRVYDRTLSYVKRKYSSKISRKVVAAGYDSDKDAVIDYCVTHTPVFDRLKK